MATSEAALRPRQPGRLRAESTGLSFLTVSVGALALGLVVIGTIALAIARGATPVASLVETLRSTEMKGILSAAIAAGAIATIAGWGSYRRMPTRVAREQAVAGAVLGAQAVVIGVLVLLFVTQGDVSKFATNFFDFRAVRPHVGAFVRGARNTLVLAAAGEAIGIVLGLVLAVFAVSKRSVVRAPTRVYVNFFRGTPLIWQISVIYFGFAIGFGLNLSAYAAAIVAFGLNTAAYAAEVFRAGIQSIERGQLEAARGLGMTYLQAMRHAVIPQAVRRVIPPLMNEFVILIKDTSLVIVLGLTAGERELYNVGREFFSGTFNPTFFVATAIGYLIVTLPLIRIVTALEQRLRSGLVAVAGQSAGVGGGP